MNFDHHHISASPPAPGSPVRSGLSFSAHCACDGLALVFGLAAWLSLLTYGTPLTHAAETPEFRVASLTIAGNTRTNEAVIRRELGFAEGDVFPEAKLDDIWDHLEDLGYFAFVDIEYKETDSGDVDVFITVEEDRTFRIYPLIRYSQRWHYFLGITFQELNLHGKGETVSLPLTFLYIQRIRPAWERPWFLGQKGLAASLTGGWEQGPFIFRPTKFSQWDVQGDICWTFFRQLSLNAGLGYLTFNQKETYALPPPTSPDADPIEHPAEWRPRWVVNATLGWDNRDLPYYPLRGAYHRLIVNRVIGIDFPSFTELIGDLRQFVPLPWRHVLALHAYGRYVDQKVPIENRLYWGGPESLRGWPFFVFEGEVGYILSCEYRWPIFIMPISPQGHVLGIGAHFFLDAGSTWYKAAEDDRANVSWGGGLDFNISSLNIRFEVARTEDGRTAFQFADRFNF